MEKTKKYIDSRIDELELVLVQNLPTVECPVVHRFTEGLYIREIEMKKGLVITSQTHNTQHPFTISKGKVIVWDGLGNSVLLEAPYTGITEPGTRRILEILEDTIWTTYHLNPDNGQDVEAIGKRILENRVNERLQEAEGKHIVYQNQTV